MRKNLKLQFKLLLIVPGTFILFVIGRNVYHSLMIIDETQEITTAHFIITYHSILDKEAHDVANTLEQNYDRLLKTLDVKDHPVVTVYLHPTQKKFDEATGWNGASGTSAGPSVIHISWPKADKTIAIHEFVHTLQLSRLIDHGLEAGWSDKELERRIGETYPRWLWESTSIYLAGELNKWGVFYYMREGHQPELSSFTRNNNSIYSVGYTIGEYIVNEWGEETLSDLVGSFGDIEEILGVNIQTFEEGWHQYVSSNYFTL